MQPLNVIIKQISEGDLKIMAGKFNWKKFSAIDLNDSFFDSLKNDYPEFSEWFKSKSEADKSALVYSDDKGVGAFLYFKKENVDGDISPLIVNDEAMPQVARFKIGTLCLAERIRKNRIGEGALGVALWCWRETKIDEIYVTVFEKHRELISLFERFGFSNVGKNQRGECVYVKNRNNLNCIDPYTSFPFISTDFDFAGLLPINDEFHDRLFPYSELAGNKRKIAEVTAGNGITKVFLASPYKSIAYKVGMPIFVYRIYNGSEPKMYRSAITSYCSISNIDIIKSNGEANISLEDYLQKVGNKSVYTKAELIELYTEKKNLIIVEMVYNGYFGKGHNVIYKDLKDNKLFEDYPYNINCSKEEFIQILKMGDVDVSNTIVDKS